MLEFCECCAVRKATHQVTLIYADGLNSWSTCGACSDDAASLDRLGLPDARVRVEQVHA
jgi:hypothetical protein